jgi:hypothetical protein
VSGEERNAKQRSARAQESPEAKQTFKPVLDQRRWTAQAVQVNIGGKLRARTVVPSTTINLIRRNSHDIKAGHCRHEEL